MQEILPVGWTRAETLALCMELVENILGVLVGDESPPTTSASPQRPESRTVQCGALGAQGTYSERQDH